MSSTSGGRRTAEAAGLGAGHQYGGRDYRVQPYGSELYRYTSGVNETMVQHRLRFILQYSTETETGGTGPAGAVWADTVEHRSADTRWNTVSRG